MSGMLDGGSSNSGTQRMLPGIAQAQGMGGTGVATNEEKANALIDAETARTEKQRIAAIQQQLQQETTFRNRGYGLRALFGALGGGRSTLLGSG